MEFFVGEVFAIRTVYAPARLMSGLQKTKYYAHCTSLQVMMTGHRPSPLGLQTLPRHSPPSLSGMSTFFSKIMLGNWLISRMALAPGVGNGIGMLTCLDQCCGRSVSSHSASLLSLSLRLGLRLRYRPGGRDTSRGSGGSDCVSVERRGDRVSLALAPSAYLRLLLRRSRHHE